MKFDILPVLVCVDSRQVRAAPTTDSQSGRVSAPSYRDTESQGESGESEGEILNIIASHRNVSGFRFYNFPLALAYLMAPSCPRLAGSQVM